MFERLVLVSLMTLLASVAFAHEEMRTPEEMLNTMMAEQGVADASQLDCRKISDEDFEMLGDSVMKKMLGDHELHEQMDVMMGGEGSASLRRMHIATGSNWLGCDGGSGYDSVLIAAIIGWVLFIITLAYLFSTRRKRRKR